MKPALAEKEKTAINLISAAVGGGGAAVAFGGGKDSVALLHLAMKALNFKFSLPVIAIDPPDRYNALYYFIEKAASAMGVRQNLLRIRKTGLLMGDAEVFVGAGGLALAASREGFRCVLTGMRKDEEGAGERLGLNNPVGDAVLCSPMADFTEEEVFEYIREYNLPLCSLYKKTKKLGCLVPAGDAITPAPAPEEDDEEAMRERLRSLGYV